ncbi:MAG TPA: FHA domain-containing protein [Pyrinomonadaceae bacterium]|jgi:pSer/pThr/pTyr-binding forkhead associated (FHA) protein
MEITLIIHSGGGVRELRAAGDRLVIGRGEGGVQTSGRLLLEDPGLDARHLSINRDGDRVWVLDENSSGGTLLNGRPVPPRGAPLADGDQIFAGEQTTIVVRISGGAAPLKSATRAPHEDAAARPISARAIALPVLCALALCVVAVALFGWRGSGGRLPADTRKTRRDDPPAVEARGEDAGPADAGREPQPRPPAEGDAPAGQEARGGGADDAAAPAQGRAKLYLQMSDEERLRFLEERAQHVSTLMGNRAYVFNDEVLLYIKQYVDVYARRVGNNSRRMWGEDLRFVFERARTRYAPHIIRAFNERGVPPVVGLYIAMIETEYHNISGENFAGAAGLFQFIAPTARLYGVDPSDRTDIEKMAPAAARYMAHRISEFGPDSMSVALAIAGYNRSPDSVRRDLRDVLNSQNKERSFWTLVANSDKLDHWFQNENVKYVPKFFAAAIVGENPEAFGLEMRKLSTYSETPTAPAPEAADAR